MKIITKKQTEKVIAQIAANYIIATDALKRAASLSMRDICDGINHTADNSFSLAYIIDGENGIRELNKIINAHEDNRQ